MQGVFQDYPLLVGIAGGAEGAAKGEAEDEAPGHRHGGRLLPVYHHYYRGDTGRFDGAGDQSTGLMAAGSSCADDGPVNLLVL